MRHRLTIEMTRAAWLGSLAAFGLVMGQAMRAEAQFPTGNAGDTTKRSSPGQTQTTPVLQRDKAGGLDARMLLGHALEMVIDGSNLQLLSMPAVVPAVGNPGTVGATIVPGNLSRTGRADNPTTGPVPAPGVGSPGTGFTGAAGETVSGRPVTPGTGTVAPVVPGPGIVVAPGVDGSQNVGRLAALQLQGQRTVETGDRLLKRAGGEAALDQRFLQAAKLYASTLRSLAGQPVDRVDGTGTIIGSGVPGTPAPGSNLATATPTVVLNGVDRASIALINHAVKEAIESMRIKQAVQLMASSDSPSAQLLLNHAREMDQASASANMAIDASAGGLQVATVQALAQQAKELILAIQGTFGEGNGPAR